MGRIQDSDISFRSYRVTALHCVFMQIRMFGGAPLRIALNREDPVAHRKRLYEAYLNSWPATNWRHREKASGVQAPKVVVSLPDTAYRFVQVANITDMWIFETGYRGWGEWRSRPSNPLRRQA